MYKTYTRHDMKKTFITLAALLPLLAACTGNKAYKGADSDSAVIQEAQADLDSIDAIPLPDLTEQGLGPVRVGMPIDSLPEGVENLYDQVQMDDTPDAVALTFLLQDKPMFTVYNFGDGNVDVISLESDRLGFRTDNGTVRLGDPLRMLLDVKGVSTDFASADDSGEWYWRCDGLWIGPDPAKCTPELIRALSSRNNPPVAALVDSSVSIGYIATGLPF